MSAYRITLKKTYSCPTFSHFVASNLADNRSLCWHQLETFKAVSNPDIDVILNYGVPNSGKSLAAYLNTLHGGDSVLGLYPNEESVKEQKDHIDKYIQEFKIKRNIRINCWTRDDLEIDRKKQDTSSLELQLKNSDILLIDPSVLQAWYDVICGFHKEDNTEIWSILERQFPLLIVDEFHQFSPENIHNVINMMFLLYYTKRNCKFLHISTTPNRRMIKRLRVLGWRVKEINAIDENKYCYPDNQIESQELQQQGWRRASQEVNLHFVPLQPNSRTLEIWLRSHSDLVVDQLKNYPGSRGAIILNSIATVKRLIPFFQELLEPLGWRVAENTQLSIDRPADLILGTNTIGLGEDNPINFLIFESVNVGQFIHRLGQLGRKDSYKNNGNWVKFEQFSAYALVPNFFVEHLFEEDSPILKSHATYETASFPFLIREAYRQVGDWHDFYSLWGVIQSKEVYQQLGSPNIKSNYPNLQQEFKIAYEEMYKISLEETLLRSQEWQKLSEKSGKNPVSKYFATYKTTLAKISCGLYNPDENNEMKRFKVYDLSEILVNLEVEPMTELEFMELLQDSEIGSKNLLPKDIFKQCLAWMKLRNFREEKWDWRFTYSGDLEQIAESKKLQILSGIQVWQSHNDWISKLNLRLKHQNMVSYILPLPVTEVHQKFRLPMHFQIYPISTPVDMGDGIAPYSVAFGQSAFWLDVSVFHNN